MKTDDDIGMMIVFFLADLTLKISFVVTDRHRRARRINAVDTINGAYMKRLLERPRRGGDLNI